MKKYFVAAFLVFCLVVPQISQAAAPTNFEDKLSYSVGFAVGKQFSGAGGDIRQEFLINGIKDAFKGGDPVMTPEEMRAVQQEFSKKMQARQQAKMKAMLDKNKAEGDAFLQANKKKKGVIVTDSGLQYTVIKEGKGKKATAADTVKVEYVGTLINKTEFDSTAKHGEPAVFEVGKVIKGWSEALQLMNVGSKYHLVIPSELAYGEQGAAPVIEPNSVLVFDVELISIEKKGNKK